MEAVGGVERMARGTVEEGRRRRGFQSEGGLGGGRPMRNWGMPVSQIDVYMTLLINEERGQTSSAPKTETAPSTPEHSPDHSVSWSSFGGTKRVYL